MASLHSRAWPGALVAAALASGACGSGASSNGVNAAPPPAPVASAAAPAASGSVVAVSTSTSRFATLALAGARTCKFDTPVEIAAMDAEPGSISEVASEIAFGRAGGLLGWQGPEDAKRAWARSLGIDGRPTAPAVAFPTPDSFVMDKIVAFEGGFAALYSVPDVNPGSETRYLQAFGPKGEPRRGPVKLALENFSLHTVSEAAGNRFIVFGSPSSVVGRQGSRVLLITVDAEGGVEQKKFDFPIPVPATLHPAVAIALDEKRWAVTVRAVKEVPGERFAFGEPAKKPVEPSGGTSPKGLERGTESLIVDGVLLPIRVDGAGDLGPAAVNGRDQLAWKGGELALTWEVRAQGSMKRRFGHLSLDGQLHAETTSEGESAIRSAFEQRVSVVFDGNSHDAALTRETQWGTPVGAATPLVGVLPDADAGLFEVSAGWVGDRFMIAYAPNVDGVAHLRVVGMRCAEGGKAP